MVLKINQDKDVPNSFDFAITHLLTQRKQIQENHY